LTRRFVRFRRTRLLVEAGWLAGWLAGCLSASIEQRGCSRGNAVLDRTLFFSAQNYGFVWAAVAMQFWTGLRFFSEYFSTEFGCDSGLDLEYFLFIFRYRTAFLSNLDAILGWT